MVSLGNPHFSLEEHRRLAELCKGRQKHPDVAVVITSGPQAPKLAAMNITQSCMYNVMAIIGQGYLI